MSSMINKLGIYQDQTTQGTTESYKIPDQRQSRPKASKIYIDPECTVEDVTNAPNGNEEGEEEDGYDADIESQMNYEVEEPVSDSDDHDDSKMLMSSAAEEQPVTQASLIRGFRNLQCDPKISQFGGFLTSRQGTGSSGSTMHKRSHSEGDLTSSDEDYYYFEREGSAATERPYVRRRIDESPVEHSDVQFDMDVDDPSELDSNSYTT